MCPAFRLDIAVSHLLEPVGSDGDRGVQACFKSPGSTGSARPWRT